jgi:hypothetical protein
MWGWRRCLSWSGQHQLIAVGRHEVVAHPMIFSITNPAPGQRIAVTRRRFVRQPPGSGFRLVGWCQLKVEPGALSELQDLSLQWGRRRGAPRRPMPRPRNAVPGLGRRGGEAVVGFPVVRHCDGVGLTDPFPGGGEIGPDFGGVLSPDGGVLALCGL